MYPRFQITSKGTSAYIQKSVRVNGVSKTLTIRCLGLLTEIQKKYGCADPRQWVIDLARQMTEQEKEENSKITIELSAGKKIKEGNSTLRKCGDLVLLPLYNSLGLPNICDSIQAGHGAKYDLNEIVRTLVMGRILFPRSKTGTLAVSKSLVQPPKFAEHDMFRALSLLCGHINDIQAGVYTNSLSVMPRRDKVIFYDCTNFYFETEENDQDTIDKNTGEFIEGLRKFGKSKENRPNPIVQMGLFMDYDGIPLAFCIFPGNCSEQTSLQPLEEIIQRKFGLTEFIVSTDAGLGSEYNRLYNMEGSRDYITVQSLKKLTDDDLDMALDPKGWRVCFRANATSRSVLDPNDPEREIFDLDELRLQQDAEKNLQGTTFYKEIIVEKVSKDENGVKTCRPERIIVTYSNDYAIYKSAKRKEQVGRAKKIVNSKSTKSRQSQQDPRRFVEVSHIAANGEKAVTTHMSINQDLIDSEARLDGFYAYGTSLDDDAIDILRVRSFHHEIEHLFRTVKSPLEARPVYLSRQDRIRSHFLICFIAMVILKMLQRQITQSYPEVYKNNPLSIDLLIDNLRSLQVGHFAGHGYIPMFSRNQLTDQLQSLAGVDISTEIIPTRRMTSYYRSVKKR